ncbi:MULTISPECIES: flagellar basal-body rod protein FlgG [Sphingobium]|jgi:flagellar basal-body rod protein FlgG|uniref:Flagellar basal-body rod protein FlgG n=2 Tax=Sphingobium baderi TaxID=1332080 RepID=A0A0S3EXD9_9SPHN|nr:MULTISPECIES: flagellar basal-body rod protein FlgG [Sphingobium]ALR20018.1 flagellar basal-body rod protein FlgG [Sphingobium baderi]EQB02480.1 flagellar basal body rod protein FlgG [Sphingobium baderi LL03]KMS60798.1 flagellar basal body rod protein FlgG [Sphingobium baderi LL03]
MTNAALHVARTGLDAQNTKMRVIANNLANVNTTGFKRDRADFETLAYQQMVAAGANSDTENKFATGLNLGSGVSMQGTSKINTQGTLQETGNALDMAIEGAGFFQVQRPDGSIAYTRAGNFTTTAEGVVVTSDGLPLIPQITVPEGTTGLTIGNDGTVSATLQGQTEATQLGQIELANFMNASGLQPIGGNMLLETAASGTPQVGVAGLDGRGAIRSGNLETSNVNVVEELVDMIETQRAYEVNSKMIKATDEMLQYVNQQL